MKKFIPWIIGLTAVFWVIARMIPARDPPGFDIDGFGRLSVSVGGRVMPMDTLARVSLCAMNHHGTCTIPDGEVQSQSRWLLDVLMNPERADTIQRRSTQKSNSML